jgi:hypothetical protein
MLSTSSLAFRFLLSCEFGQTATLCSLAMHTSMGLWRVNFGEREKSNGLLIGHLSCCVEFLTGIQIKQI